MFTYEKNTKIGRVTIDLHGSSFRLRFTYPKGQRQELKISKISDEGYALAIKKAHQINTDIENDCFDFDYVRYKPDLAKFVTITSKELAQNGV